VTVWPGVASCPVHRLLTVKGTGCRTVRPADRSVPHTAGSRPMSVSRSLSRGPAPAAGTHAGHATQPQAPAAPARRTTAPHPRHRTRPGTDLQPRRGAQLFTSMSGPRRRTDRLPHTGPGNQPGAWRGRTAASRTAALPDEGPPLDRPPPGPDPSGAGNGARRAPPPAPAHSDPPAARHGRSGGLPGAPAPHRQRHRVPHDPANPSPHRLLGHLDPPTLRHTDPPPALRHTGSSAARAPPCPHRPFGHTGPPR
jgi:hypothetical protein